MAVTTPPVSSPHRGRGRTTADAMRSAALELFVSNGFDATSMREIARRVGVSAAAIYNHTDSKESLLWEIVRGTHEELRRLREEARATTVCPADRVRAALVGTTLHHAIHPREALVLVSCGTALHEHAGALADFREAEVSFFAAALRELPAGEGVRREPGVVRLTSLMLIESTSVAARAGAMPDAPATELADLVAGIGLRAAGIDVGSHRDRCVAPGSCQLAEVPVD